MFKFLLTALLLSAWFTFAPAGAPVRAETNGVTFSVNNTADEPDANVNDGVCSTALPGICTLRAAVMQANALAGTDTILLGAGTFKLTRLGADDTAVFGDFDITENVIIQGFGSGHTTIDGDFKDRVFDLQAGTNVEIHDLRIYHGNPGTGVGGGIRSLGSYLKLTDVLVDTNFAGKGGGIFVDGANVYAERVTMKFNHATTFGGAILNGAEKNIPAILIVLNSTLQTNYASAGAGIYNENSASLINSTLSSNLANSDGGGIANVPANLGIPLPTSLDLSNVTIASNRADEDMNGSGDGGGIYVSAGTIVTLRNSILANNRDMTSGGGSESQPHDCFGGLTTAGYNLIRNGYGCTGITHNQNGDQFGNALFQVNARLFPLADNGGATLTHGLESASPAVDAGNPGGCKDPYSQSLVTDQRNYLRPVNGGSGAAQCDIGAFERDSQPVSNCTTKPAKPALALPLNGGQTTKRAVALDWDGVTCTTSYQVLVKKDAKKGVKADSGTVQTSSFITKKLVRGHTYFWKVKACNDFGCTKSVWFSFHIK